MYLSELIIHRFPSVKPGTHLRFHKGFNIVLGKNGTGKTTMLKLVSSVVRSVFQDFVEVDISVEFKFFIDEETSVRAVLNSKPSNESMVPPVYGYAISIDSPHGLVSVVFDGNETSVIELGKIVYRSIQRAEPFRYNFMRNVSALLVKDMVWELRRNLDLSVSSNSSRFDESLEFYNRLVRQASDGQPHFRIDLLSMKNSNESNTAASGMYSKNIESLVLKEFQRTREGSIIRVDVTDDPTMTPAWQAMTVKSANCVLKTSGRHDVGEKHVYVYESLDFDLEFDNKMLPTQALSYGEKRMLSFFYYLSCNPSIVIADELVNGLHHDWIRTCVDAIQDRQSFLTSQNPILLDYMEFSSVDDVRSQFILCRADGAEWVWEQLTEEQADTFFRAYQVGIQHVSEILRSQGLW